MVERSTEQAAPMARVELADVWAGVAAMLVTLPSALAFGVTVYVTIDPSLVGAGAISGIIGAIALGIVAPLVGRNRGFISAPCAPAAAVLSGLVASLAAHGEHSSTRIIALLALTALISASLQVVYGALRLGRLVKFIPYQVVTGYLSAVALLIAGAQLPKLLGVSAGTPWWRALIAPDTWAWQGLLVGTLTLLAMFGARRWVQRVPAAIIALAAGIATYMALALLDARLFSVVGNPLLVGKLDTSVSFLAAAGQRAHALTALNPGDLGRVLAAALTLSVLLSIDTLKTGVVLDALTYSRHKSNRELLAQGAANLASFALGGMPGAGALGPTLVNISSGSRTLWSSVVAGGLCLLVYWLFGGLIAWVPIAALAGILLAISYRMFDFGIFRLLRNPGTRLDFIVVATVIAVGQILGLIEAAVAGICLAILLFIRDQIRSSVVQRKRDLTHMRSRRRRSDRENELLERDGHEALVLQLRDNLFFGSTDQLLGELDPELSVRRFLLFDLRRVMSVDYTAAHLFEQVRHRLAERHGALLLCGMPSARASRQDIERYLEQVGLYGADGVRVFESRDAALEWMEDAILESAGWHAGDPGVPLELGQMGLFRGIEAAELQRLAEVIAPIDCAAGARIFVRGDPSDEMYLLRAGTVHIRLPLGGGKYHHLATFGPGELFGELAFLDQKSRSADAVAVTPTSLYVLSRQRFAELERSDPALAVRCFERLARITSHRLRQADAELLELEER